MSNSRAKGLIILVLLFTLVPSAVVIGLFNEAFSTQVAGMAESV